MTIHENGLPTDESHEIACLIFLFLVKAAEFENAVCWKLKVTLHGLSVLLDNSSIVCLGYHCSAVLMS